MFYKSERGRDEGDMTKGISIYRGKGKEFNWREKQVITCQGIEPNEVTKEKHSV